VLLVLSVLFQLFLLSFAAMASDMSRFFDRLLSQFALYRAVTPPKTCLFFNLFGLPHVSIWSRLQPALTSTHWALSSAGKPLKRILLVKYTVCTKKQ